ncbi:hypothetical protein SAMN05446635_6732 [Burkholderia sp. OK233]|nr:hypothetical protein SAMN05446635_6732 [Burkholderia sp. OK233]
MRGYGARLLAIPLAEAEHADNLWKRFWGSTAPLREIVEFGDAEESDNNGWQGRIDAANLLMLQFSIGHHDDGPSAYATASAQLRSVACHCRLASASRRSRTGNDSHRPAKCKVPVGGCSTPRDSQSDVAIRRKRTECLCARCRGTANLGGFHSRSRRRHGESLGLGIRRPEERRR